MNVLPPTVPVLLFIGPTNRTIDHINLFLRTHLCKTVQEGNKDCYCTTCAQIEQRQHANACFIKPTREYLLDDIAPIFSTITFKLDDNEQYFFVLENTELLTAACANRLLKVLEEPHQGYHFLLHATNESALLPTIRSRSQLYYRQALDDSADPIISALMHPDKLNSPTTFEKLLKTEEVALPRVHDIIHQLPIHLQKSPLIDLINADESKQFFLENLARNTPLSGGGNAYLKMIYLTFSSWVNQSA